MTRREKLVERLRRRPPHAAYADVRNLLEWNGWEHASIKGSHARFRKRGERSITVPVHNGKVKREYLDEVLELLQLDDEAGNP